MRPRLKLCSSFVFLGVTILLSLTVFLNMVAETMPATSDAVPLLGKLYLAKMVPCPLATCEKEGLHTDD